MADDRKRGPVRDSGATITRKIVPGRLRREERKLILDKLIKENGRQNSRLRRKIRERLDRAGVQRPEVEVRFENLSVSVEVLLGQQARQTLLNYYSNGITAGLSRCGLRRDRRQHLQILDRVSGVLRPGRMTLLLGPPASGKSTLLQALAGRLPSGGNLEVQVSGNVTYSGRKLSEFVVHRTAAYLEQQDIHIPHLTVRETLNFSARCQGVGNQTAEMAELRKREKRAGVEVEWAVDTFMKACALAGKRESLVTDYVLRLLDLEICQDTLVGNDWFRGVSGGQRKRVSAGEILVGPKQVYLLDEPTTGLDSSTAQQVVRTIGDFAHMDGATVMMALLQPSPEIFRLFDDVMLLSDGICIYYGPCTKVLPFFEGMGFQCPPRMAIPGFLQNITSSKDQQQYWAKDPTLYRVVSVRKFADAYARSDAGVAQTEALLKPFNCTEESDKALAWTKFALTGWQAFKACLRRECILTDRYQFLYKFRTCQVLIMATITGTVFLKTRQAPTSLLNGQNYMSVCFYSVMVLFFNGQTELTIAVDRLPAFYKQRLEGLHPAWAYTLPITFLRIFYSLTEAGIWSVLVYWLVGFAPDAGRFLVFFAILFLVHQNAVAMFRVFAALTRDMVVATSVGSLFLVIYLMLSGYILAKPDMPNWWVWAYWLDPFSYAIQGLIANEFSAPRWNVRGFRGERWWSWVAIGVLTGSIILFNGFTILFHQIMPPFQKPVAVMSEDSLEERIAAQRGTQQQPKTSSSSTSRSVTASERAYSVAAVQPRIKHGMVLPFCPVTLTFRNIHYFVDLPAGLRASLPCWGSRRRELEILKGISGIFRPGVLTALVGVSGAGKTTLLDILAGRKTTGRITGEVRVNGHPWESTTYARLSGYVEQTDIHSAKATVHEALMFSAALRMAANIPRKVRVAFVEEMMELVELTGLRDLLVGVPGGTGLSVEQRKRLSIAVELIPNPSVVLMDEPTTGLDARAAAIVMRVVRNIVDTGRTITCTVHQPSIEIFEAFDELLLLKRGGQTIYCGPLGAQSSDLVAHFQDEGGVGRLELAAINPATWVLDISTPACEDRIGVDFADIFAKSELARAVQKRIAEGARPSVLPLTFLRRYAQPLGSQLGQLLVRNARCYWRTPDYNATRMAISFGVALIFGSMYWMRATRRLLPKDILNIQGALYFCTFFMGIVNSLIVQPVAAAERTVFYRERAAGMYSVAAYSLAMGLVEVMYNMFQAILYSSIVYFMVGFSSSAGSFFWFAFFMFATLQYCTMYGIMAVAVTPNLMMAAVLSSAFFAMWNLFAGFIIPKPRIPDYWSWYYYLNPFAWSIYGLVASQLGDDFTNSVNTYGFDPDDGPFGQDLYVAQFVYRYYGYDATFLVYLVPIVLGFTIAFWGIATAGLKYLVYISR
ncbi:ATP-binding cassette transporter [Coccomyxa subellipsoidea C-169]|uniref:ATP-binding cassette transporter n=1 Tax=Coccomyxa subellipsoidea (strain C-169) TaxID=574566 RepID=I0Z5J4_COCSC|nr:ATP-binding cassette transporter [Coccomyxa subellipsoidea C-169]EIE25913.1 ATP-binding cassette transporter [Coccomyxa subellipsoidea C-169]|eukprot:XP_005650457.1 ATP-binding cassette transporter [Coccomyxa subellipsoidea C-169]